MEYLHQTRGLISNLFCIIRQLPEVDQQLQDPQSEPPIGFLNLPLELRVVVYRELLVRDFPAHIDFEERNPFTNVPTGQLPRFPAILRTSKQIHQEALETLYSENLIGTRVDTGYLNTIGLQACAHIKKLIILPPKSRCYYDRAPNFTAWHTLCNACLALQSIQVSAQEVARMKNETGCLGPLLALSVATGSCASPSPASIKLSITMVGDRTNKFDKEWSIYDGFLMATGSQCHRQYFRMQRAPRSSQLTEISTHAVLDRFDMSRCMKEIAGLDWNGYGFVCLNHDFEKNGGFDDTTQKGKFEFEWKPVVRTNSQL